MFLADLSYTKSLWAGTISVASQNQRFAQATVACETAGSFKPLSIETNHWLWHVVAD